MTEFPTSLTCLNHFLCSIHIDGSVIVICMFFWVFFQAEKESGVNEGYACLSDFIAPKDSSVADYIGAFAVSVGFGVDEMCAKFEKDMDDYSSIMCKAVADRLAEVSTG